MFKIRRSNAVDEERSIIGLKDYYVTQLTTLMTRILAWFLLRRFDLSSLHPRLPMAINTVVAIITILVSLLLTISLDFLISSTNVVSDNSLFLYHGED